MVDPVLGGAYVILDDNQIPRLIVEDDSEEVWEQDTFDRVNTFAPPPKDKANYDGSGGVEISGSRWGKEFTAGEEQEGNQIYDELSQITVVPSDPANRGQTGYTSDGMRTEQSFGIDCYVDGEKITARASMAGIPSKTGKSADSDIIFPGVRVEGGRIQYVYNFAASEFRFVSADHKILNKPSASPVHVIPGSAQSDYGYQNEMSTGLVTWITRGGTIFDRVTKKNCALDSGVVSASVYGADGWSKSGWDFLNDGLNGNGITFPASISCTVRRLKPSTSASLTCVNR
jgi:hypothetical protein